MLDLASQTIQNFPSQTGTDGVLAKSTESCATDFPHRRGECHPAHVQLPGANMRPHQDQPCAREGSFTWHKRISLHLSHLTPSACWHIPEFTLTPSSPPDHRTLTPLAHQSSVVCVVSVIFKTIQVLQLEMTTVITVSNSVAISNSWQVLHTPEPHTEMSQSKATNGTSYLTVLTPENIPVMKETKLT